MSDKIEVDVDEVKRLFAHLEELHEFFHQPSNYDDAASVKKFLQNGAYERLRTMYYDVVWKWLPPETRHGVEEDRYSLVEQER